MKKLLAGVMSVLMVAACFSGCGSTTETTTEGTTAAPADTAADTAADTEAADTTAAETEAVADDGANFGTDVSLKLWGAQEDQDMLKSMVETFKAQYPNTNWDITFGVVSEADAKTEVLKDPEAAADVFAFASDQLGELYSAGTLYRVSKNADTIKANNSEASIAACTEDGELYAYPSSSDTYFLYYDKALFTDDEVKSLDTILAKDLDAGVTNFSFDIDNGWYNAGFFFSAGCKLFGETGVDPTACDFNSANGVKAADYMIDMVNSGKFANHDDGKLKAAFTARQLGATVTGSWNAADIQAALGDDFGVTKLPELTFEDGTTANLGSMANFKLYGVSAQTAYPLEAMALAEFLTGEDCQKIRFDEKSFAPTNLALANDAEALASNPVIAAAAAQGQYATLQASIKQMGNFWTPAEAFGAGIEDGSINKDNIQEKLDLLVESILATIA